MCSGCSPFAALPAPPLLLCVSAKSSHGLDLGRRRAQGRPAALPKAVSVEHKPARMTADLLHTRFYDVLTKRLCDEVERSKGCLLCFFLIFTVAMFFSVFLLFRCFSPLC